MPAIELPDLSALAIGAPKAKLSERNNAWQTEPEKNSRSRQNPSGPSYAGPHGLPAATSFALYWEPQWKAIYGKLTQTREITASIIQTYEQHNNLLANVLIHINNELEYINDPVPVISPSVAELYLQDETVNHVITTSYKLKRPKLISIFGYRRSNNIDAQLNPEEEVCMKSLVNAMDDKSCEAVLKMLALVKQARWYLTNTKSYKYDGKDKLVGNANALFSSLVKITSEAKFDKDRMEKTVEEYVKFKRNMDQYNLRSSVHYLSNKRPDEVEKLIEIDNINMYNAIYDTGATELRHNIITALNKLADMMLELNTLSSKLKMYRDDAIEKMGILKDVREQNEAIVNGYIAKVNRRLGEPTTTPEQIRKETEADQEMDFYNRLEDSLFGVMNNVEDRQDPFHGMHGVFGKRLDYATLPNDGGSSNNVVEKRGGEDGVPDNPLSAEKLAGEDGVPDDSAEDSVPDDPPSAEKLAGEDGVPDDPLSAEKLAGEDGVPDDELSAEELAIRKLVRGSNNKAADKFVRELLAQWEDEL
tara:strand:+ start:1077 stop:2672 length:1596 start_codon:yes stop_codon:yes gene_type:complete